VKIGQRMRVTTDTYPGKAYEGCVFFIARRAITPRTVRRRRACKLVYRVKVDILNPLWS
jgi:HlyD family secretion protein